MTCKTACVGLFSRASRAAAPSVHPVSAFWEWWAAEGRAVDPHRHSRAVDRLTTRLQAIDPGLTWHFGEGAAARYRLTASAGGVAEVRPAAERWLRAAPAADAMWEFRASQEADPEALTSRLEIGGSELDLSLVRFRVDVVDEELRVHVGVHHPMFAALPGDVAGQVTFLVLDWLLGEDDVERWVAEVETLVDGTGVTSTAEDLRAAVGALAASRDPQEWTLARWQDADGHPGLASFRRGLRWIDTPLFDRHHVLTRGFAAGEDGLPADGSALDELGEVEDALVAVVGPRGVLVGHETFRGVRTFHVYADGEDQNVDAALEAFASEHGLTFAARPDAAWSEVRHLTG